MERKRNLITKHKVRNWGRGSTHEELPIKIM